MRAPSVFCICMVVGLGLLSSSARTQPKLLRIGPETGLDEGCLGWSERAGVTLCVFKRYNHGSAYSTEWSATFVGPGALAFKDMKISGESLNHVSPEEAKKLQRVIKQWDFVPVGKPRLTLRRGAQKELAGEGFVLRWTRSYLRTVREKDDMDDRYHKHNIYAERIEYRCGGFDFQELRQWESGDEGAPPAAKVYTLGNHLLIEIEWNWSDGEDLGTQHFAHVFELRTTCGKVGRQ